MYNIVMAYLLKIRACQFVNASVNCKENVNESGESMSEYWAIIT